MNVQSKHRSLFPIFYRHYRIGHHTLSVQKVPPLKDSQSTIFSVRLRSGSSLRIGIPTVSTWSCLLTAIQPGSTSTDLRIPRTISFKPFPSNHSCLQQQNLFSERV